MAIVLLSATIDSIAIDGFSDTPVMHNIDEKGRKDVLVTTAVSEKLMLKGLHTYLETLDERYVKVKVKIEFTNYLGVKKVLLKKIVELLIEQNIFAI